MLPEELQAILEQKTYAPSGHYFSTRGGAEQAEEVMTLTALYREFFEGLSATAW